MKQCLKCLENKDTNSFDKERNVCKPCRNKQKAARPKKKYEMVLADKKCVCCDTIKSYDMFNKDTSRIGGLSAYCNECRSTKNSIRYKQNPEKKKINSKKRYQKIKHTEEFLQKNREYRKHKEQTDIFFKLKRRLRNRLYYGLKNKIWKKNTTFSKYIGCDREVLIEHIEKQFESGMTWENYGDWHIDHIMPLSSAQNENDMYKLCHYTNLRPLWGKDNYIKSDNFVYEVKPITFNETKPFILGIHYAQVMPSISYSFGLFRQNILVGVCTFGIPFSPGIRSILPNQILELNRLVLSDNLKNEASRLVSGALNLLPKNNIIISFADPTQGHEGTVYKATNFEYYGLTEKRNNMVIEGSNNHSFTNGLLIKNDKNIEYHYEQRTQKHRYITYVGSKGFKKFAKSLIKNKYHKK